jgi:hypothetical protein
MAQAACNYLPIPASEANIEHMFNIERDILGVRQFSLKEDALRALMMLKNALQRAN